MSNTYLIKGKELYQGDSILWRKELKSQWDVLTETIRRGKRIHYIPQDDEQVLFERTKRYINAMDAVIKSKAKEIVSMFGNLELKGKILDVGAGSGAFSLEFIKRYSNISVTLLDLENVINLGKEKYKDVDSIKYHMANILEEWKVEGDYQVIILSNILHAYSEDEVEHILDEAVKNISNTGCLVIHDFFMEHSRLKAGLTDLNMMINTYNGKVFYGKWIGDKLTERGLNHSNLVPLEGDTGVVFASPSKTFIESLALNKIKVISQKIADFGFNNSVKINPQKEVFQTSIAPLKCEYGCGFYAKGTCQTEHIHIDKARQFISEFSVGILIEGEPPTKEFQISMLQIEKEAFKLGFYKAFILWAGPCSLCERCKGRETHCSKTRPSMESYGIDVFKTVREKGIKLKTLDNQDYVKYFGLLLLE
nr:DUF2284 domain-containing protein [Alkalibaculum sporogenes]